MSTNPASCAAVAVADKRNLRWDVSERRSLK
jgi:hypothetical protein